MSPVLRSEEYGGLGKLKSYQVNIKRKEDRIIPISLTASSGKSGAGVASCPVI